MPLIPTEPKRRNAVLAVVLALAAAYFFHSLWYSPKGLEIDELEAHFQLLEAQNRSAQRVAAQGGRQLELQLAQYETHVRQLERLIPKTEEVAALLNDMAGEGRRIGVELLQTVPEEDVPGPYYTLDSYAITVLGEYHDVGRFLSAVASLDRIIRPMDLEITLSRRDPSLYPDFVAPVEGSFRIETYIIPDDLVVQDSVEVGN